LRTDRVLGANPKGASGCSVRSRPRLALASRTNGHRVNAFKRMDGSRARYSRRCLGRLVVASAVERTGRKDFSARRGDDSNQLTNASIYPIVAFVERSVGLSPGIQNGSTTHRLGIQISENEDECRRSDARTDAACLLFGHDDYEIRCSQILRRDQRGARSREVDAKFRCRNERGRRSGPHWPHETCRCHVYVGRDLGATRAQECCSCEGTPADIAVTDEKYRPRVEALQLDLSCAPTPSVKPRSRGMAKVSDPRPPRHA